MTTTNYDMASASSVEDLGPIEPGAIEGYRASVGLQLRHQGELLAFQRAYLGEIGLPSTIEIGDLTEYFDVRRRNPAFGIRGTTPGNLTLWLFMIARVLAPAVIVESGTFMGSSLFTMRNAAPTARMYSFDLDFSNLVFKDASIDYRARDFGTDDVRSAGPNDLCYFNDHINNCMRIRQCYERGFKHLVLDDTPDLGEIQAFRFPALPAVAMIAEDKWRDGDTIEWVWNDRRLRYTFRTTHTFGARELIDHCRPIPALRRWTGLQDSTAYYVKLK